MDQVMEKDSCIQEMQEAYDRAVLLRRSVGGMSIEADWLHRYGPMLEAYEVARKYNTKRLSGQLSQLT
jgi:hypothetical protein